jgi:hypothetical protein
MSKSEDIKAPFGDGTNVTNVRLFTCDSTSRANALPASWSGKYIEITNETANLAQYFFSQNASATCDETIAAADAGASSASLGGSIAGSASKQVLLPYWANNATVYFVRASVTSTSLRLEERSNG